MDKVYLQRRKLKHYTSYRLNKRKAVIIDSLKDILSKDNHSVLDLGTADGQLLDGVTDYFNFKRAVGIDVSEEALRIAAAGSNRFKVLLGNGLNLPFADKTFDLLIASAVFEHIENIDAVLKESYRVLKDGGLICFTLPNPFFDWINSKLVKTYHVRRYGLKKIVKIVGSYGFKILVAEHFMFSPFGNLLFGNQLERFMKFAKLDFLLFNHVTIARKM